MPLARGDKWRHTKVSALISILKGSPANAAELISRPRAHNCAFPGGAECEIVSLRSLASLRLLSFFLSSPAASLFFDASSLPLAAARPFCTWAPSVRSRPGANILYVALYLHLFIFFLFAYVFFPPSAFYFLTLHLSQKTLPSPWRLAGRR